MKTKSISLIIACAIAICCIRSFGSPSMALAQTRLDKTINSMEKEIWAHEDEIIEGYDCSTLRMDDANFYLDGKELYISPERFVEYDAVKKRSVRFILELYAQNGKDLICPIKLDEYMLSQFCNKNVTVKEAFDDIVSSEKLLEGQYGEQYYLKEYARCFTAIPNTNISGLQKDRVYVIKYQLTATSKAKDIAKAMSGYTNERLDRLDVTNDAGVIDPLQKIIDVFPAKFLVNKDRYVKHKTEKARSYTVQEIFTMKPVSETKYNIAYRKPTAYYFSLASFCSECMDYDAICKSLTQYYYLSK